jgi:hypothetical protein
MAKTFRRACISEVGIPQQRRDLIVHAICQPGTRNHSVVAWRQPLRQVCGSVNYHRKLCVRLQDVGERLRKLLSDWCALQKAISTRNARHLQPRPRRPQLQQRSSARGTQAMQ